MKSLVAILTIALLFLCCSEKDSLVTHSSGPLFKEALESTRLNQCNLLFEDTGNHITNVLTRDSLYATVQGTTIVPGISGNARHFEPVNDYIFWNDSRIDRHTLNGLIIQFWVRLDTITHANIVFKGNPFVGGGSIPKQWAVVLEPDSSLRFQILNNGAYQTRTSTGLLVTNTWYNILCIWGATGRLDIYVDNVLQATSFTGITSFTIDGKPEYLGPYTNDGVDDGYFSGTIDNFQQKVSFP